MFLAVCVLSSPVFVLAAPITPGSIPEAGNFGVTGGPTNIKSAADLLGVFASVVGWVYTAFFITAVLFFIFAAFSYLTGADSPEKIKTAHKQLIYGAVAIGVALLAVLIQVIIGNFIKNPVT